MLVARLVSVFLLQEVRQGGSLGTFGAVLFLQSTFRINPHKISEWEYSMPRWSVQDSRLCLGPHPISRMPFKALVQYVLSSGQKSQD